jgi:serine/threonine-protein kinase PknG
VAAESAGRTAEAARWYDVVSRTDPAFTSAAFGLARCRADAGDRPGALEAYERVPDSSSAHLDARTAHIRCLIGQHPPAKPSVDDVVAAGEALAALPARSELRMRLTADVLEAALMVVPDNGRPLQVAGMPLRERDLRVALEETYRVLARRADDRLERVRLVDAANAVRPRTWT